MNQPKGVRDFLPKEKIIRNYIVNTLITTFENFGFNPIETPALELFSTLTAKGGITEESEAYQEIYKFKDRANRLLGLKFDQTVPLARVLAMNPQIPKPFKRYIIDRAWRDGPTKVGRYKEFWQCDVDTIGVESIAADAEIIAVIDSVFKKFGLDVIIKINNRNFLNGLLEYAGIPEAQKMSTLISIDKLEKIGKSGVLAEIKQKKINEKAVQKVLELIEKASIEEFEKINEAKKGLDEIKELLKYCSAFNVKPQFSPSLARGLNYYTGTVIETFLKSEKFKLSLVGGGRYDKMIGQFMGIEKTIPAVGVGFGLDTIYDALLLEKKIKLKETVVDIFIIPIGNVFEKALEIASKLREAKINTDIDLMQRSISKNLEYANKQGIPYVIFFGENEAKQKKVKLRDMKSGKEEILSEKQLIEKLKKIS
ncbi:MAG: histidine--tRNA ligase [Candidatus Pacearchaeota archaeon]